MALQTWAETLVCQTAVGTAFNNFTTAQSVLNAQCLYTFPASWWAIGRCVTIEVWGGISNIVTTPGTIAFSSKLGSVVAFTTGAIQLNATAHTDLPFKLEIELQCRAVGSGTSANLMGMALMNGVMITNSAGQTDGANTNTSKNVPATTPAVGTGWDSTTTQQLDFFTAFSIADTGNQITVDMYRVISWN